MILLLVILLLAGCGGKEPKLVTVGAMEMQTIAGLTAEDIYRHYATVGFKTETNTGSEISVWTSIKPSGKYDLVVTTTGKKNTEIVAVDAYFKNYTKQNMNGPATRFLSDVAAQPFNNHKSFLAEQWATSHIQTGGDTTIADVSLRLINQGDSLVTLKMSVGQWR